MLPMAESDSTAGRGASGLQIWSEALSFARHAEAIGLDSIWPCDHFLSEAPGGPVEGILEGWTVLSALAAVTDRIELGQMVMCASYRDPGLLAKMASTAQAVSGGRVVLGVGAGWYDREYRAFGYPTDHRVDRFEEALQIIVPLVRGNPVSFVGRYHTTKDAQLLPPPVPSIPVLVAAKSPRMLQLTARYADAWNTAWFGTPTDELERRLADLGSAMQAEGRPPNDLRRTVGVIVRDPDQVIGEPDPAGFGARLMSSPAPSTATRRWASTTSSFSLSR
jgi:alkanesulfonate monooxygenase SsuD/methylene tetrahydromethanopterin reductase-like flavin-dependent oxidoreductase (luciferase family)